MLRSIILTILIYLSTCVYAQYSNSYALRWQTPTECEPTETFNTVLLQCVECRDGLVDNPNHIGKCRCAPPLRLVEESNGEARCERCASDVAAIDEDTAACVECVDVDGRRVAVAADGHCPPCTQNTESRLVRLIGANSTLSHRRLCSACASDEHSDDDKANSGCVPCRGVKCFCDRNPNACRDNEALAASTSVSSIIESEIAANFNAATLADTARYAALVCSATNVDACQLLANLCVLQAYNRDANTACTLLESLRTSQSGDFLPSIVYTNTEASVELAREGAIDAIFNVDSTASNSFVDLVAAVYALDGSFLGLHPLTRVPLLQLCPSRLDTRRGAFRFGRLYEQNCRLSIAEAIAHIRRLEHEIAPRIHDTSNDTTLFYELFLRYTSRENERLMYPVPVLNENIRARGLLINQQSAAGRWLLTKRFFLADRRLDASRASELLRVPVHMSLHIHLQISRDGHILPPHFRIRHHHTLIASNERNVELDELGAAFQFRVNYVLDSRRHDKTIEVLMATLCSFCLLWGALEAYSWSRRAGKLMVDASTILTFVLAVADNLGNIFLLVMASTAIWLTLAYKLQKHMVYVPLTYEQEFSFIAYIIAATALRGVGLVHTLLQLVFTETFFVDWERPKGAGADRSRETTMLDASNADLGSQKQQKRPLIPVVIWRTYHIASKWIELQCCRKTCVGLQLVASLLILDYLHLADIAIIQPGFALGEEAPDFAATRMSRWAIDVLVYTTIGLMQWLISIGVLERVTERFRNFMDLCSIANVSVLAFTHAQRAFYIHGRSVHGTADTDLLEMNTFLQREKENLCALRGLESGAELQTFVACLPRAFRVRMDETMAPMRGVMRRARSVTSAAATGQTMTADARVAAQVEANARIHADLTQIIKDYIDHVEPNCDYVITDTKLIEDILDVELNDTSQIGHFARDASEIAYTSCFLYGNEWPLLSFEMLLFALISLTTESRVLAASVVFVVSTIIAKFFRLFVSNNLVKSSFVDQRFFD